MNWNRQSFVHCWQLMNGGKICFPRGKWNRRGVDETDEIQISRAKYNGNVCESIVRFSSTWMGALAVALTARIRRRIVKIIAGDDEIAAKEDVTLKTKTRFSPNRHKSKVSHSEAANALSITVLRNGRGGRTKRGKSAENVFAGASVQKTRFCRIPMKIECIECWKRKKLTTIPFIFFASSYKYKEFSCLIFILFS